MQRIAVRNARRRVEKQTYRTSPKDKYVITSFDVRPLDRMPCDG